jgi:hypothetical protein
MEAHTKGVATLVTYDKWITKCERIGAFLGGVAGFFYGAYVMAANLTFVWTDLLDTMGSVALVLLFAGVLGGLCIAIGWLAGLFVGVLASPLGSFSDKRGTPGASGPSAQKKVA